ncbi:MAG: signal peptidase I [Rhodospirillaceae bacterium]
MPNLLSAVRELLFWIVAVLLINTAAFGNYYIPSESMTPNLLVGDRLVVSKFAYGYSNHSIVGAPDLFEGRILERPAARGDVAVFHMPNGGEMITYVKRIVGLPGDVIAVRDGVLSINGVAVRREQIGRHEFRETLPEGRSYMTFDRFDSAGDDRGQFTVPPGHYFAMGDNRDNSADSRWLPPQGLGYVPAANLIGRADIILWSWAGWREMFRPERTFARIH